MADEEDGDANDEIEDEEDEASEKLMVLHINFVNLKLPLQMKTSKERSSPFGIWGFWE